MLDRLVTDLWMPPDSRLARLAPARVGRRLRDRFHTELPVGKVRSFPGRTLAWELLAGLRGLRGGRRTLAHNAWWSSLTARALHRQVEPGTGCVFGYSYASNALFAAAAELGLAPILGQIDPGPVEDAKVAELVCRWPAYRTEFKPGAAAYYARWREECRLARHIVVNSEWSKSALVQAGIAAGKIAICPLVYTPPPEAASWTKNYPAAFSRARPLRVLFLGQCILRKGIAETIEAARRLADRPVEFTFVGNTDIAGLEQHFGPARIRCFPRVSRLECQAFYREADVFIFPTHSDGFGLTQLEAQAWKLPIIASHFCAKVVEPGRTGWIVPEVTGDAVATVIEQILGAPGGLDSMSRQIAAWPFGLEQLGRRLVALDVPPTETRPDVSGNDAGKTWPGETGK